MRDWFLERKSTGKVPSSYDDPTDDSPHLPGWGPSSLCPSFPPPEYLKYLGLVGRESLVYCPSWASPNRVWNRLCVSVLLELVFRTPPDSSLPRSHVLFCYALQARVRRSPDFRFKFTIAAHLEFLHIRKRWCLCARANPSSSLHFRLFEFCSRIFVRTFGIRSPSSSRFNRCAWSSQKLYDFQVRLFMF